MNAVTHDDAEQAAWPVSGIGVTVLQDYITQQRAREAEQQAEIERLRNLLQQPQADNTHQCRICLFKYTPLENESEECPKCEVAALNTEGAKG